MLDRWHQYLVETGFGALLFSVPFWRIFFTDISLVAQFIAGVCGAIMGLHGVYRIFKRYISPEGNAK
jgi:hypothetical protein